MIVRERSHLHPAARQMLDLDDEQRVRALRTDRWIDYPRATQALQRLQRLLDAPQRERMPCMLLHGPSNIGKTLIVAKFLREQRWAAWRGLAAAQRCGRGRHQRRKRARHPGASRACGKSAVVIDPGLWRIDRLKARPLVAGSAAWHRAID